MDLVVNTACDLLAQGRAFVLATIIERQGSAPRMQGTRMIIAGRNEIYGTIGGGLLEAETMLAAEPMNALEPAKIVEFDLTDQHTTVMEMMCGGRARVLLDYISPNDENLELFNDWRNAMVTGRKVMLVSAVTMNRGRIERIEHALIHHDSGQLTKPIVPDDILTALTSSVVHANQIQVRLPRPFISLGPVMWRNQQPIWQPWWASV